MPSARQAALIATISPCAVEHLGSPDDRTHRHHPGAQGLRETDEVGLDAVPATRQDVPGPTESGLDLVRHEKRPRLATRLRDLAQDPGAVLDDPLALDRFVEERGDRSIGERATEGPHVAEGHLVATGDERAEAALQPLRPVQRERTQGQSVERVGPVGESRPPGRGPRDLHRRLDRLRPAVHEEDPILRSIEEPLETVGERHREWRELELDERRRREIEDLSQGIDDHRVIPTHRVAGVSPDRIEMASALLVHEPRAAASDEASIEADESKQVVEAGVEVRSVLGGGSPAVAVEHRLEVEVRHGLTIRGWSSGGRPHAGCRR